MGATADAAGVNFAVFSAHADGVDLCLFSADGLRETARIALPERDGDIWHGRIDGLRTGQLYGRRLRPSRLPRREEQVILHDLSGIRERRKWDRSNLLGQSFPTTQRLHQLQL